MPEPSKDVIGKLKAKKVKLENSKVTRKRKRNPDLSIGTLIKSLPYNLFLAGLASYDTILILTSILMIGLRAVDDYNKVPSMSFYPDFILRPS